jgi:putative methionine-R-sulfoxide reductase with GAF domain
MQLTGHSLIKSYISILKKTILTYCCLHFFTWHAISQLPDYHVQVLQKKIGLVYPNQVEDMIKDDKGFLWLLTPSKAQRFDGKNILTFSFDDRCIAIQQDEEGTVFVLSRQNIYRYKNDHTGFEKLPEYTTAENKYRSLVQGPGKKIYLLTVDGVLKWNRHSKKMEPMGIAPFKSRGSFPFLRSFGNCIFYRLDDSTLLRYNVTTAVQDAVKVQQSSYVVPINEDSVWVRQGIGNSMLVSFKTKTAVPVTAAQFNTNFNDDIFFITGGFSGAAGEFFVILNAKGYYSYNAAKKSFTKINVYHAGRPLQGNPVLNGNNYYRENNGSAWFANEEGLVYFNSRAYHIGLLRSDNSSTQATATDRWNNDIRSFAEDDKGNIWFGTANGFCKWDKKNGHVETWIPNSTVKNYLNYSSVKSIGFNGNKFIIGQSERGFWIFNPAKQTFNRPKFEHDSLKIKFEKAFNTNMLKLANGNFLALSGGAWLIDKETFFVKQISTPPVAAFSRKAYEDAQGRIWMLGTNGIFAADKNFNLLYALHDKVKGKWYNAIVQINEETFWVAAKDLYEIKLQPQNQLSIKRIFTELKNVYFSNLFKDSLGHIWMCNDDGMYRYIPEKKSIEKFEQSDNVNNFYVAVSNSFRGSDGTVYFGSMNGINYFVPEKIPLQNDSLQVLLLNVTVNRDDSSYLLNSPLADLTYYQNAVTFDFITAYLYNGEKIQYRYKMEGADNDWVNLGNVSSVRFNSLEPGRYSFTAAASLNGKDWYPMLAPFTFVIHPPFWKTWWFSLLFLLTIAALTVFLVIRRIRFIKKREAEKTELQKIKAANYQGKLEAEQVINYFATSISGQNTVEEMLWGVAKNLIGKLGFEDCMIYLWNKDKTVLMQRAGYGSKGSMQSEPDKNIYNVPKGKGIVGAAVESRHYILANDTSLDTRYFSVDEKVRLSELCVPIIHNNEAIGAINTEHSAKNFHTDGHLQILTTIASMLADKIDAIESLQLAREKELELLKLNKDLAISQLTTLRAQMNPHFIFNALNSIQQYILQGDVVEANRYLSKFSKLQREILLCSNQNFISMEKEIEILNSYLQLEQLRFGESFTYAINMTDEIDPTEIKIPPMMLQPFVENAIWHGLMPKQCDKNLKIYFDLHTDDILLATIRDNGIGREASAKLKQNNGGSNNRHESKGMSMVHQRLQLLQQQYDKPFEVSVSDITDVNGMVQGTQVTLKIFIGDK